MKIKLVLWVLIGLIFINEYYKGKSCIEIVLKLDMYIFLENVIIDARYFS